MNSYVNNHRKPSTFMRNPAANSMSLVTGLLPVTSEMALFEFPFNELLVSPFSRHLLLGHCTLWRLIYPLNHPLISDLGGADKASTDGGVDVDAR